MANVGEGGDDETGEPVSVGESEPDHKEGVVGVNKFGLKR